MVKIGQNKDVEGSGPGEVVRVKNKYDGKRGLTCRSPVPLGDTTAPSALRTLPPLALEHASVLRHAPLAAALCGRVLIIIPLLLGRALSRPLPCGTAARVGHRRPPPALALVSCPKQRHPWATVAHRGARGTLDEFKAAWVGRLAHHGGIPKILPGNLPPAAIADRWIGLQPYPP